MTLFLILGAALFVGIILYFAFRNKEEDVMSSPKSDFYPEPKYTSPTRASYRSDPRRSSSVSPTSQPASNAGNSGGIGLLETVIIADMLTHHDHTPAVEEHRFSGGESGGAGANGDWDDHDRRDNSDNYNDNSYDHDTPDHDSGSYDHDSSSYDSSDSSSYDSGGSDFGGSND